MLSSPLKPISSLPMRYEQRPNYFLCDTPPNTHFSSDFIIDAADTLRRNAELYLHHRTIDQQVSLIENLISIWSDEMFPLRCELLGKSEKEIPFSREILSHGLEETFRSLSRERIYHLLKIELGHEKALDGWFRHLQSDDVPSHSSHHFSFRLVGSLYQRRVPSQLLVFMVKCLLAKTSQWIICSPQSLEIAKLFAHSIYQIDPKAASCIEVVEEEKIKPHLDTLKKQCEFFRTWIPQPNTLSQYGRSLGFVWVSADYITQNGLGKLTRNVAQDVTAWDQFYPGAPHNIFIQQTSGNTAAVFAEKLLDELADLNVEYPHAPYSSKTVNQINTLREIYKLRGKTNSDTLVFEDGSPESPGCSVIYEMEPNFSISIANRFVFVKPVPSLEDLLNIIEPNRDQIASVGIAVTPEEAASTARTLAFWGVPRICSVGMMHRPCIYKEGGVPGLQELSYKSFWEKSYNNV